MLLFVAHSVVANPSLSISGRSLELGIPQSTLYRILDTNLSYKVLLTQELAPTNHQLRRIFSN